jgi:hypothetical protein
LEIEAARYPVHFTDSSVISLSMGFILFCSDLSKVFALSLAHEKLGSGLKVVTESSLVYAKIGSDRDLKYYWTEIIGAHAYGSGPTNVEHRIVTYPGSITRQELLWAMERFSVAHEYAHHIAGHGKREFATRGLDAEGLDEEYEADVFALALSRHLGSKDGQINLWSVSEAGAVLLLTNRSII